MTALVIILAVILIWMIFGNHIKAWLQRRAQQKFEDILRAQMGMPSAKEQRRQERQAEAARRNASAKKSFWTRPPRQKAPQPAPDTIIPKEYAVDVEYTEIKEYSRQTIIDPQPDSTRIIVEDQVEDVKYVEIKTKD